MCSAGSWSARLLWTRPSVPTRFPVAVHIAPSGRCFLAQWTECSPGGGYGHAEVALPQARIEQAHRSLGLGFGTRTRKMLRLRTESRIQPGLPGLPWTLDFGLGGPHSALATSWNPQLRSSRLSFQRRSLDLRGARKCGGSYGLLPMEEFPSKQTPYWYPPKTPNTELPELSRATQGLGLQPRQTFGDPETEQNQGPGIESSGPE